MTIQFYENQIFEGIYPPEAANWCNNSQVSNGSFYIVELDPIQKDDETIRRFQIKRIPEPSSEELKERKRQERDNAINSVIWLIERHQQEQILDIPTTLTDNEYMEVLQYIQSLRDLPQQPSFPNIDLPIKPSFI